MESDRSLAIKMPILPSLHAIVVGIEEYGFPDSDLLGPAEVAITFAEWLLHQGVLLDNLHLFISPTKTTWEQPKYQGFLKVIGRIPPQAKHDVLYTAITDKLARLTSDDAVIIFWAGHGIQDVKGNRRLYFCNSSERNYLNLNVNSLLEYLSSRAIQCKEQLVIVDACSEFDKQTKMTSLPSGDLPRLAGAVNAEDYHQTALYSARLGQFTTFQNGTSTFFTLLMNELQKTPTGVWPPPQLPAMAATIVKGFAEQLKKYLEHPEAVAGVFSKPYFYFRNWQGNEELSDQKMMMNVIRDVKQPNAVIKLSAQLYLLTQTFVMVPSVRTCLKAWWQSSKNDFLQSPVEKKVFREGLRRGGVLACQVGIAVTLLILASLLFLNYSSSRNLAKAALGDLLLPSQQNSFTAVDRRAIRPLINRYQGRNRRFVSQFQSLLSEEVKGYMDRAEEDPLPKDDYPSLPLSHKLAHLVLASYVVGDKGPFETCVGSNTRPTVRYCLIHWLADVVEDPTEIGAWVSERAKGPDGQSYRITEALLIALGEYLERESANKLRSLAIDGIPIKDWLKGVMRTHPDPGVHGASEWLLLSMFGREEQLEIITKISNGMKGRPAQAKSQLKRPKWFVDLCRNTMIVLPAAEDVWIGGDDNKVQDRSPRHKRSINRTIAIGSTEITVGQYREFCEDVKAHPEPGLGKLPPQLMVVPEVGSTSFHPVHNVSWDEAARFCNWLSRKHKLPECYRLRLVNQQIGGGVEVQASTIAASVVDCPGYRLPTEVEWEYAANAESGAARFCGNDTALLERYAWINQPRKGPATTVQRERPNSYGLFDVYGNVAEWCHDDPVPYPTANPSSPVIDWPRSTGSVWRCVRGFMFSNTTQEIYTAARYHRQHNSQEWDTGFRVARTILPSP